MEPYILVMGGHWSSAWDCLASARCHTAMPNEQDRWKRKREESNEKQRKRNAHWAWMECKCELITRKMSPFFILVTLWNAPCRRFNVTHTDSVDRGKTMGSPVPHMPHCTAKGDRKCHVWGNSQSCPCQPASYCTQLQYTAFQLDNGELLGERV